ncbi:uncharacterized protein LOC119549581 [Drosophila subpulchrella]|uniref:uncharacterized protein LOC119549581 n=1 Tax=Drosophila subpulchrella TaxID=1486046 RepID=UPI0018A165DF|nr:uncharacterized protein LOC119549581 [Drosophila subpulchrella]
MAWFIIILLWLGSSRAQFLNTTSQTEPDLEERLFGLLQRLQTEKIYDTLLIYGRECAFLSLSRRLQVPTVLVSSGSTNFEWNFSSLTLILSCEFQAEREKNYRTLMKLQLARRIILLRGDFQPETVCDFYSKKDQYNIAMVKENFDQFGVVYSCRLFQDQNYDKINLLEGKPIFIEQFRNMHGAPIRTFPDVSPPRCMAYQDAKTGEEKYIGFVANLLNNFVTKVNATLSMQMELAENGEELSFVNITNWAAEDLLDIGMSEALSSRMSNFDSMSYPYLMSSFCFMIPLPDKMPFSDIYMAIVAPPALIVLFIIFCIISVMLIYIQKKSWRALSVTSVLLNDICVRGFLAQPFPFPRHSSRKLKLIFMIICFCSVITTTMYVAYLQAFLWAPPVDPLMTSFADVEKSRYKMAITIYDVDAVNSLNVSKEQVVVLESSKFYDFRGTFNDKYIYPVTAVRWATFEKQQDNFAYPLFYYSETLCVNYFDILGYPIRRFLPYRDLFEEHMLRQKEFGLTKLWLDRSFWDMLRLNYSSLEDFSQPLHDDYIEVHNLYWVLCLYFAGLGLGCICFILELITPLTRWGRFRILQ